jgi:hypothetical protein
VARQLVEAGLVDRLRLTIFPLVAGPAGRGATFDGMASTDLELVGHRVRDGRVLLVEYRPTGEDIPRGRKAATPVRAALRAVVPHARTVRPRIWRATRARAPRAPAVDDPEWTAPFPPGRMVHRPATG